MGNAFSSESNIEGVSKSIDLSDLQNYNITTADGGTPPESTTATWISPISETDSHDSRYNQKSIVTDSPESNNDLQEIQDDSDSCGRSTSEAGETVEDFESCSGDDDGLNRNSDNCDSDGTDVYKISQSDCFNDTVNDFYSVKTVSGEFLLERKVSRFSPKVNNVPWCPSLYKVMYKQRRTLVRSVKDHRLIATLNSKLPDNLGGNWYQILGYLDYTLNTGSCSHTMQMNSIGNHNNPCSTVTERHVIDSVESSASRGGIKNFAMSNFLNPSKFNNADRSSVNIYCRNRQRSRSQPSIMTFSNNTQLLSNKSNVNYFIQKANLHKPNVPNLSFKSKANGSMNRSTHSCTQNKLGKTPLISMLDQPCGLEPKLHVQPLQSVSQVTKQEINKKRCELFDFSIYIPSETGSIKVKTERTVVICKAPEICEIPRENFVKLQTQSKIETIASIKESASFVCNNVTDSHEKQKNEKNADCIDCSENKATKVNLLAEINSPEQVTSLDGDVSTTVSSSCNTNACSSPTKQILTSRQLVANIVRDIENNLSKFQSKEGMTNAKSMKRKSVSKKETRNKGKSKSLRHSRIEIIDCIEKQVAETRKNVQRRRSTNDYAFSS